MRPVKIVFITTYSASPMFFTRKVSYWPGRHYFIAIREAVFTAPPPLLIRRPARSWLKICFAPCVRWRRNCRCLPIPVCVAHVVLQSCVGHFRMQFFRDYTLLNNPVLVFGDVYILALLQMSCRMLGIYRYYLSPFHGRVCSMRVRTYLIF